MNHDGAAGTTTIESKTNFLGAVRAGTARAVATPLHVGGTTLVVETTNITDQMSIGFNGNGLRHSDQMRLVERFRRVNAKPSCCVTGRNSTLRRRRSRWAARREVSRHIARGPFMHWQKP